jgi:hypothetical protein
MANKAGQYWNGTTWAQLPAGGLTTEDITIATGIVANEFYSIKDASNNMYVLCCNRTGNKSAKLLKLSSSLGSVEKYCIISPNVPPQTGQTRGMQLALSKDNSYLFIGFNSAPYSAGFFEPLMSLYVVGTDFTSGVTIDNSTVMGVFAENAKFAIYKDLYIWVASGTTVKIYDYNAPHALLASSIPENKEFYAISCSTENILYTICYRGGYDPSMYIMVYGYNSTLEVQLVGEFVFDYSIMGIVFDTKQLLIDPYGDLIILTNSGTASTLLKYTTAGVQIGTAITLASPSYNLNVDIDGNYFYYTALAEYMVPANATAGQPIKPLNEHIKTRGTGIVGYGSNTTGHQPSVYAE